MSGLENASTRRAMILRSQKKSDVEYSQNTKCPIGTDPFGCFLLDSLPDVTNKFFKSDISLSESKATLPWLKREKTIQNSNYDNKREASRFLKRNVKTEKFPVPVRPFRPNLTPAHAFPYDVKTPNLGSKSSELASRKNPSEIFEPTSAARRTIPEEPKVERVCAQVVSNTYLEEALTKRFYKEIRSVKNQKCSDDIQEETAQNPGFSYAALYRQNKNAPPAVKDFITLNISSAMNHSECIVPPGDVFWDDDDDDEEVVTSHDIELQRNNHENYEMMMRNNLKNL
eukprot:GDKJ01023498.1.p1 GENE.GDKJ01023498.1~~GDKJ01023498.1.p1  ORF type:complete len:285 (+),score=53.02 GDKJ01023498.1:32-886(+)